MAFVDIFSILKELYKISEHFIEDSVDSISDMKLQIHFSRWYRMNRGTLQVFLICISFALIAWLCVKGYLVQLARRARLSIEDTIATKVDQIARQFDDALQVSFRRATWELVKDNVGVYALQGRRGTMEDRFTFVNRLEHTNISIYAVFDGHGGELAAEYVEKALFKKVMTKLLNGSLVSGGDKQEQERSDSIKEMLMSSHLEVDKSLINLLQSVYDGSGTTSIMAVLDNDTLYVANVGDSRAVMCDQHLEPIPLSYDHKPDLPEERARIEKAGGFVAYLGVWRVNGILATSRALGDASLKHNHVVSPEPDIRVFKMSDHKPLFMILATDGLWDVFSNAEAVRYVHNHLTDSDFGAKSLANEAYNKGSLDNISVIVVNFTVSNYSTPVSASRELN